MDQQKKHLQRIKIFLDKLSAAPSGVISFQHSVISFCKDCSRHLSASDQTPSIGLRKEGWPWIPVDDLTLPATWPNVELVEGRRWWDLASTDWRISRNASLFFLNLGCPTIKKKVHVVSHVCFHPRRRRSCPHISKEDHYWRGASYGQCVWFFCNMRSWSDVFIWE